MARNLTEPGLIAWSTAYLDDEVEQPGSRTNRIRLGDLREGLVAARADLSLCERQLAALPEGDPRRRHAAHNLTIARKWVLCLESRVATRSRRSVP